MWEYLNKSGVHSIQMGILALGRGDASEYSDARFLNIRLRTACRTRIRLNMLWDKWIHNANFCVWSFRLIWISKEKFLANYLFYHITMYSIWEFINIFGWWWKKSEQCEEELSTFLELDYVIKNYYLLHFQFSNVHFYCFRHIHAEFTGWTQFRSRKIFSFLDWDAQTIANCAHECSKSRRFA